MICFKPKFFVFENVTWPRKTCGYSDTGNGQLLLWTANYSEAKDEATKKATEAFSKIDKVASKGIINKRKAANQKSRISKHLDNLK